MEVEGCIGRLGVPQAQCVLVIGVANERCVVVVEEGLGLRGSHGGGDGGDGWASVFRQGLAPRRRARQRCMGQRGKAEFDGFVKLLRRCQIDPELHAGFGIPVVSGVRVNGGNGPLGQMAGGQAAGERAGPVMRRDY